MDTDGRRCGRRHAKERAIHGASASAASGASEPPVSPISVPPWFVGLLCLVMSCLAAYRMRALAIVLLCVPCVLCGKTFPAFPLVSLICVHPWFRFLPGSRFLPAAKTPGSVSRHRGFESSEITATQAKRAIVLELDDEPEVSLAYEHTSQTGSFAREQRREPPGLPPPLQTMIQTNQRAKSGNRPGTDPFTLLFALTRENQKARRREGATQCKLGSRLFAAIARDFIASGLKCNPSPLTAPASKSMMATELTRSKNNLFPPTRRRDTARHSSPRSHHPL